MFKLVRTTSWYNPMELFSSENVSLGQVGNILFYNKDGVQYDTGSGWFGVGNNPYKEIYFPKDVDIKQRRKLDFERGGAFYMRKKNDISNEYEIWLYIPCEMFGFKYVTLKKDKVSYGTSMRYETVYEIKFNAIMCNGDGKVEERTQKLSTFQYRDTAYGIECEDMAREFSKLMFHPVTKTEVANLREKYDIKLKK